MQDQTGFSQSQEMMQAPPTPQMPVVAPTPEEIEAAKKKKKIMIIVGLVLAGLVGLVVVGMIVLAMVEPILNPPAPVFPEPTQVTLPTNPDREPSAFRKRLDEIEKQIDESDPSQVDLDPPPLNYSVKL